MLKNSGEGKVVEACDCGEKKPKLAVIDKMTEEGLNIIAEYVDVVGKLDHDCDAVYVHFKKIDFEKFFEAPTKLKYVLCPCTGIEQIPIELLAKNGVSVIYLDDKEFLKKAVHATSEFTVGLILGFARRIVFGLRTSASPNRDEFLGSEIKGKRVGIIGCGRVGQQVAKVLLAFGAIVSGCDDHIKFPRMFDELLRTSDIITVHVPLTSATANMFGDVEFGKMKKTAVLINTSRGGVIAEEALVRAVQNDTIRGIAIDVVDGYSNETRLFLDELSKTKKSVLVTPHIAGFTAESREVTDRHILNRFTAKLIAGRRIEGKG